MGKPASAKSRDTLSKILPFGINILSLFMGLIIAENVEKDKAV
jgi:hypothetical protein